MLPIIYCTNEISMQNIMLNPVYNIALKVMRCLIFFTNDPYRRGGLTLNFIFLILKYLNNCSVFVTIIINVHTLKSQRKIQLKISVMA